VPTGEHLNPAGTVHGGLTATLLDSCMGPGHSVHPRQGTFGAEVDIGVVGEARRSTRRRSRRLFVRRWRGTRMREPRRKSAGRTSERRNPPYFSGGLRQIHHRSREPWRIRPPCATGAHVSAPLSSINR
jgi:hypothetical protein